jgi:hypothetical protein
MKKIYLIPLLPTLWLAPPALAETINCPDLSNIVQIGTCPSEEELQFTFNGYCSDNARMMDKPEEQLCTDYALYRRMKNFSLWETADGEFSAYLSCEPNQSGVADAKANTIQISKQGSVTRVTCGYTTGVNFTYRTKAKCTLAAGIAEQCSSNPQACQAQCD